MSITENDETDDDKDDAKLIVCVFVVVVVRNITGNPLACDCDLLWLIPWSLNMTVKLQPAPKCETPAPFKGVLLKKLKIGDDLHCDTPLEPLLDFKPEQDQVNRQAFRLKTLTLTHPLQMLMPISGRFRRRYTDTAMSSATRGRRSTERLRRPTNAYTPLLGLVRDHSGAKFHR